MPRSIRRIAAVTAVMVVPAAPAVAATALPPPQTLASVADRPWVFVDRQGVTHVVYDDNTNPLQSHLWYRRAQPGSSTFSPAVELPVAVGVDFAGTYITQDAAPSNRLVMLTGRCCTTGVPETWALTSTDNGATWSTAVGVSDAGLSLNPGSGRTNLVANGTGLGGGSLGIWFVNGNPSMRVAKVPSALTPLVPASAQVAVSADPIDGQVVFEPSGNPILGHASFTSVAIRSGEGGADQALVTGSVYTPSLKLASGPKGTVALTVSTGAPTGDYRLQARTVTGGVVGPPVNLAATTDSTVAFPYLSADPSGRFHAVWRGQGSLIYRRSEDGVTWTAPRALTVSSDIYLPVVAAGADGNGWALWQGGVSRAPLYAQTLAEPTTATDPSVPDTTGIVNPRVTRRGTTILVSPRTPGLAALRRSKCVNVRVQSTRAASVRVAIFSGRKSVRIFGATVVRFPKAGKKLVCVRVPLRARTFDVRQPFRFAFATRYADTPANRPVPVVQTPFTFFR